ncbi:CAP domain-containing protein [Sporosarcina sp. 179-K 3D1 HS]|uniref:CAP domain-containing protein n=1 Tax=Sporosarcina sp. 179-K 3D1 HS TaxID=3232169 RepID=UPI0039A17042
MKKSIAVILLGSALLLPNNNSAEASGFDAQVKVKNAPYVQVVKWEDLSYIPTQFQTGDFGKVQAILNKLCINLPEFQKEFPSTTTTAKPVEKAPTNTTAKPAPTKPAAEKPAEQAAPSKPAAAAPVAKPQPAPATPQPAPAAPTPAKPVEQPAKQETAAPAQNASVSAVEQAVLDLTNAERQKAGLKPLQIDSKLMNSARQKSNDMASNNYFSHTSPTYGSPFDQMKANGVTYRSAAENIAMGQRTAEEVVKAWMESPGHRQNILTPEFTHIGIGYDQNGNYWTQQFIQK